MSDERLTDELARRGLGLRPAPGRYLKSDGGWIVRSKFRPLVDIRDAFLLLDALAEDYALAATAGGVFTAQVRIGGRIGKSTSDLKARAISLAVAKAIGLEPEGEAGPSAVTAGRPRGGHRGT